MSPNAPQSPSPLPQVPVPSPAVTRARLFGRDAALGILQELLLDATARDITVCGPLGSGTSALANEAIYRFAASSSLPILSAPLNGATDLLDITATLCHAFEVQHTMGDAWAGTIVRLWKDRPCVLAVDGVSPIAATTVLETLLERLPHLRLMMTSVTPVGLPNEHVVPLGPLSDHSDARALFEAVVGQVEPALAFDEVRAEAIKDVCTQLGGWPLALELVAAQLGRVPVAAVIRSLNEATATPPALAPPDVPPLVRQVIAWCLDTLQATERQLLLGMAVFASPCTTEGVQQVCCEEAAEREVVHTVLASLQHQRLVTLGESGYTLPPAVRACALAVLESASRVSALRQRHAAYCVQLARTATQAINGVRYASIVHQLETSLPDLRSALRWALLGGDAQAGAQLAAAAWRFWDARGYWDEGEYWLGQASQAVGNEARPLLAELDCAAGHLALRVGQVEQALEHYQHALAIATVLQDDALLARVLDALGTVLTGQGEASAAMALHARGVEIAQAARDPLVLARALNNLGLAELAAGRAADAEAHFREGLHINQRLGRGVGVARALSNLALAAHQQGKRAEAMSLQTSCVRIAQGMGDPEFLGGCYLALAHYLRVHGDTAGAARCLDQSATVYSRLASPVLLAATVEAYAHLFTLLGDADRAALAFAAAQAARIAAGASLHGGDQQEHDYWLERAREVAGAARWEPRWAEGSRLSLVEAAVMSRAGAMPAAGDPALGAGRP